ncbi:MAG TPA: PHP domain-containing protein [Methylomirabilota bacterium]|nr:PHP domain-containing protein [Methylomirabilota bacterium]
MAVGTTDKPKRKRSTLPKSRKLSRDAQPQPLTSNLPLTNSQIAELLALEGEKAEGHVRKALYRAAHEAFVWPEEAALLVAHEQPLTQLPAVGPFIAKTIKAWVEAPPTIPEPPVTRRQFITLAEARRVLAAHPSWRDRCKGDLQMHSTWSDGAGSVSDMALEGMRRGYEYICITDHTKGLKIAGGCDESEIAQQAAEIGAVNAEFKRAKKNFRVLHGVEMNLSPDGSGDMEPAALRQLDLVLGSFHSALRVKGDQTERYIAGLRNPHIQVLGHPKGRVYNYREGLVADWRRVFAEAARLGKAVEIDGYSDRQDMQLDLLEIAREEGVRVSMGSDAHAPGQMLFLEISLALACLAKIPAERIINFMPHEELAAWVEQVRVG